MYLCNLTFYMFFQTNICFFIFVCARDTFISQSAKNMSLGFHPFHTKQQEDWETVSSFFFLQVCIIIQPRSSKVSKKLMSGYIMTDIQPNISLWYQSFYSSYSKFRRNAVVCFVVKNFGPNWKGKKGGNWRMFNLYSRHASRSRPPSSLIHKSKNKKASPFLLSPEFVKTNPNLKLDGNHNS